MKVKIKDGEVVTVLYMGPEQVEVPGALGSTKLITKTVMYAYTKNDTKPKRYLLEEIEGIER
jgi:hypothetical protein